MTIPERVLAHLKEHPGNALEIAEALNLQKIIPLGYKWGKWDFEKAEDEGLIEWRDDKWHLKEAEG